MHLQSCYPFGRQCRFYRGENQHSRVSNIFYQYVDIRISIHHVKAVFIFHFLFSSHWLLLFLSLSSPQVRSILKYFMDPLICDCQILYGPPSLSLPDFSQPWETGGPLNFSSVFFMIISSTLIVYWVWKVGTYLHVLDLPLLFFTVRVDECDVGS